MFTLPTSTAILNGISDAATPLVTPFLGITMFIVAVFVVGIVLAALGGAIKRNVSRVVGGRSGRGGRRRRWR